MAHTAHHGEARRDQHDPCDGLDAAGEAWSLAALALSLAQRTCSIYQYEERQRVERDVGTQEEQGRRPRSAYVAPHRLAPSLVKLTGVPAWGKEHPKGRVDGPGEKRQGHDEKKREQQRRQQPCQLDSHRSRSLRPRVSFIFRAQRHSRSQSYTVRYPCPR